MILALRTDKPEAELYLLGVDGKTVASHTWQAHRELADTLLPTIENFLAEHQTSLYQLTGLVIYTGSGSFTGLRIGTTTVNAIAYSLHIPVVACRSVSWQVEGVRALPTAEPGRPAIVEYGSAPNITQPNRAA